VSKLAVIFQEGLVQKSQETFRKTGIIWNCLRALETTHLPKINLRETKKLAVILVLTVSREITELT